MYQVYIKTDSDYNPKELIGEFINFEKACDAADEEVNKNKAIKYVIEETSGEVSAYGDLITRVVREN